MLNFNGTLDFTISDVGTCGVKILHFNQISWLINKHFWHLEAHRLSDFRFNDSFIKTWNSNIILPKSVLRSHVLNLLMKNTRLNDTNYLKLHNFKVGETSSHPWLRVSQHSREPRPTQNKVKVFYVVFVLLAPFRCRTYCVTFCWTWINCVHNILAK